MSDAICEVCGERPCPVETYGREVGSTVHWMRGYKRQKARAEAAEKGWDEEHASCNAVLPEVESRLGDALDRAIDAEQERDALRAEMAKLKEELEETKHILGTLTLAARCDVEDRDAARAELASLKAAAQAQRPSVEEIAWECGSNLNRITSAITHERTIAAQQRRALRDALRRLSMEEPGCDFDDTPEMRCPHSKRCARCAARAALKAAQEKP